MMEIRSYRRVFDLERRIYRVDRLRLNPGGVPVRGVLYFLAILCAVLIVGRVPVLAIVASALPWYVRYLALPCASAAVLTMIRVEGRPFHLAAHALVRYGSGPRRLAGVHRATVGERWRPGAILMLPDGSDASMRRLRYAGPGAVLVAVTHERAGRSTQRRPAALLRSACRPALTLRGLPQRRVLNRAHVIVLARGERLIVRSDTAAEG
jgi:hypothetical protein